MRRLRVLAVLAVAVLSAHACSREDSASAADQAPAPAARAGLQLAFPVDCRLGVSCEIQNYVDSDPAEGAARDYRGGSMSYDDHSGVDIRVPTLAAQAAGVRVLAAADGVVLRLRDGVPDISVRSEGRAEAVENAECGNGVVLGHVGGYETQYCHLALGSISVAPGAQVKAGDPIGRIGLSGQTEYPHLHFTVRKGGQVVDPFAAGGASLWPSPPPYRLGAILNTGFRTGPVTMPQIEAGAEQPLSAEAPAIVAFGRAIGLKAGDVQELVVRGPGGEVLVSSRLDPLPRNQAQNMAFAGKKRPPAGWPRGTYEGVYRVWRGGEVALERTFRTTL